MALNLDIVLKILGSDTVKSSLLGVGTAAQQAGAGLDQAGTAAAATGGNLNIAGMAASEASQKLGELRNMAAGLAAAGVGGIVLSNKLIQISRDSEDANLKMEAMAKKRGEGGRIQELDQWANQLTQDAAMIDDDPIRQAAAGLYGFGLNADRIKAIMPGLIGQSRLYNQSLDSTSMMMGKAFASGNVTMLKRAGVTIDPADIDRINSITNFAQKQAAMFDVVKRSMDHYALSMTEGMTEAEKAANHQAAAMDNVNTAIGAGSDAANVWIGGITTRLAVMITTNKDAANSFGWALTMGSYLAAGAGSLVAFGSQLGMAYLAMAQMKTARIAAKAAALESAAADTAAAAAKAELVAAELAATEAAIANGTALEGQIAATVGATAATDALAVSEETAAAAGGGMRLGALGAMAGFAALGAGAGLAIEGLSDHMHNLNADIFHQQNAVDELRRGWMLLWGDKKAAEADVGEKNIYKPQLDQLKVAAAEMRSAGKSEAEIAEFVRQRTMAIEQSMADQDRAHGDMDLYAEHSQRLGQLRAQGQTMGPMEPPTAVDTGDGGSGGPATSNATSAKNAASAAAASVDAIQAKIDSMQAAGRGLKGDEKTQNAAQVKALQRQKTEAIKAAATAKRNATLNAGASASEAGAEVGDKIDELKAAFDEYSQNENDSFDNTIYSLRQAIKHHQVGQESGQARLQALQDVHQHVTEAEKLENDAKIARLNSERILAVASAKAQAQDTVEAAATMRKAQADSKRALRESTRDAARALRERLRAQDSGSDMAALTAEGGFRGFARPAGLFGGGHGGLMANEAANGTVRASQMALSQNASGAMTVQFAPIVIPQGGLQGELSNAHA